MAIRRFKIGHGPTPIRIDGITAGVIEVESFVSGAQVFRVRMKRSRTTYALPLEQVAEIVASRVAKERINASAWGDAVTRKR